MLQYKQLLVRTITVLLLLQQLILLHYHYYYYYYYENLPEKFPHEGLLLLGHLHWQEGAHLTQAQPQSFHVLLGVAADHIRFFQGCHHLPNAVVLTHQQATWRTHSDIIHSHSGQVCICVYDLKSWGNESTHNLFQPQSCTASSSYNVFLFIFFSLYTLKLAYAKVCGGSIDKIMILPK